MADGPLTIGRPQEEDKFLTCGDFINAGLWNHGSYCKACHQSGDMRTFIKLHLGGTTREKFPSLHISVCCGFAGQQYTADQIEQVIQLAYGGDDC